MVDWNLVDSLHNDLKGNRVHTLHDYCLAQEMVAFISLMEATSIFESGTAQGTTTRFLAEIFPHLPILTCDISSSPSFSHKNIVHHKGNSPDCLSTLTAHELGPRPFFFLDAHARGRDNPLCNELGAITEKLEHGNIVAAGVVIHDFEVPDQPHLGWNDISFDKTDLTWDTIKFVEPFAQVVWYPSGKLFSLPSGRAAFEVGRPDEPNPRGRILFYLSFENLPESLEYLHRTGLLRVFYRNREN